MPSEVRRALVDLKAKPFYLTDEEIKWVENTLTYGILKKNGWEAA